MGCLLSDFIKSITNGGQIRTEQSLRVWPIDSIRFFFSFKNGLTGM